VVLRAVLFDFNGVLVDDEPLHRALTLQVLGEAFNLEVSRAEYRRHCLGRPDREALRAVLEARGLAVGDGALAALVRRKTELYRERAVPKDLLVAGVQALLADLVGRGMDLAVVTGSGGEEVSWLLENTGLREYFALIVAAEDIQRGKPDPEGYRAALGRLGCKPEEALAVEDSLAGIEAARRAGLWVLALTTAVPMHLLQRRTQWVVDRYEQLDLGAVVQYYGRTAPLPPSGGSA
jgi:beta-phosphoglucomutase